MIEVFPASQLSSAELLRPTLVSAVRDPQTGYAISPGYVFHDEIAEIIDSIDSARRGLSDRRYYAIARDSGSKAVVGMMGLQWPDLDMWDHVTTPIPAEIVNAYVHADFRGNGAGRALVQHLTDKATQDGHTELVLNSGPRYRETGWPFWTRLYGEPVGRLDDHYGPGYHAMVWRAPIDRSHS